MEKIKGKIISYFEDKGYGYILDEKGKKRFFHVSDATKPLEMKTKIMVEFEASENHKGLNAKKIDIIQSNSNSKFIKIFGNNIKCSNIKNFGLAEGVKTLYKRKKGLLNIVFDNYNEKLYTYDELPESNSEYSFGNEIDFSEFEEVKRKYNYLYITTYQDDNYTWEGDLEELEKILEYIESNV